MRHLWHQLLRFFLPWACAGCRRPLINLDDEGFCGACWLALPRIQGLICRMCGIPLPYGGSLCFSCRRSAPPVLIRSASVYRGPIPPALHRYKYLGRKSLKVPFGALLQHAWEHNPELHPIDAIVPVPLYPPNERARGYNQAELLAQELSRRILKPVFPMLVRTRKTDSQISLNRTERRVNLKGAFAAHPLVMTQRKLLKQRSFLLIDDVCTTTSTLAECAKALFRVGIRSVCALVLARDL